MWRIIIFAAYLFVSGQFVQSKELPLKPDNISPLLMFDSEQLLGENRPQSLTPPGPPKPQKESTTIPIQSASSFPTTEENSLIPSSNTKENHHHITFDQRQEGQYNIRADLDNFMIVVIPPNPSAGVNLLDLLTRSTLNKRSNLKKQNKKHFLDGGKLNRPLGFMKNNQQQQQQNYLNRSPYQFQPNQPVSNRFTDFIEGRTPYRVDISSNAGENSNSGSDLNNGNIYSTDTQIDVIPPPIPSNYHQLMKPYHLEVEPSIINHESQLSQQQQQQLSQQPTVLIPNLSQGFFSPNQGNLMDLLNRASGGRFSKSIKSQFNRNSIKLLNTNGLNSGNGNGNNDGFSNYIERYNNKRDIEYYPYYMGITNDAIYPPLSYDSINFNEYNKKLDNDPDVDDILDDNNNNDSGGDNISTPSDNWEFKLIGATEQCGPDRVRDSYGVCQFIKNI